MAAATAAGSPAYQLLSTCNQLLSVGALRKELALRSTAERECALAYIAGRALARLPAVPQSGGESVDRQVDPGDDIVIRAAGAIALQQLDLHVIEGI